MTVKQLTDKIEELRKENPNIDDMEIGPIFYNNGKEIIMMVTDIYKVKDCAWDDGGDAIGIEWMT